MCGKVEYYVIPHKLDLKYIVSSVYIKEIENNNQSNKPNAGPQIQFECIISINTKSHAFFPRK